MKKILLLLVLLTFSCNQKAKKEQSSKADTQPNSVTKKDETPKELSLAKSLTKNGFHLFNGNEAAPEIKATDLNGKVVKLSDYKGKLVLLNFWATWCPPCIEEMPSMEQLYDKFKDKDFALLAVSFEDKLKVKEFINLNEYKFTALVGQSETVTDYGVSNIPATFIVGKDGKLIAGIVGGLDWYSEPIILLFQKLIAM